MDSSDESDMDDDLEQPAAVKTKHHDLMMKGEGGRKGSFFKQAKKSYPMFPTHEERIKWDEYGEIIRSVFGIPVVSILIFFVFLCFLDVFHYCLWYVTLSRPEEFLVPELQATEEEKSKLESGMANGDEPMEQDLSDVPTKCISIKETLEIRLAPLSLSV